MTYRVELRWATQIGRLLTQARSGQSDDETEAGMGNGRKDIDLEDDRLYLLEISIASSPSPRGLHILGCFQTKLQQELREIRRKTAAMFHGSESVK